MLARQLPGAWTLFSPPAIGSCVHFPAGLDYVVAAVVELRVDVPLLRMLCYGFKVHRDQNQLFGTFRGVAA